MITFPIAIGFCLFVVLRFFSRTTPLSHFAQKATVLFGRWNSPAKMIDICMSYNKVYEKQFLKETEHSDVLNLVHWCAFAGISQTFESSSSWVEQHVLRSNRKRV